jgi:hypothetical protein
VTALLPDHPVARRLSIQSIFFALGDGVFTTGNAVYFTQIVGLSAAQVGLGLSITGVLVRHRHDDRGGRGAAASGGALGRAVPGHPRTRPLRGDCLNSAHALRR